MRSGGKSKTTSTITKHGKRTAMGSVTWRCCCTASIAAVARSSGRSTGGSVPRHIKRPLAVGRESPHFQGERALNVNNIRTGLSILEMRPHGDDADGAAVAV